MVAASFWSLLAPAIELAEKSGTYGSYGEYAFVPVAGGFLFGAIFVFGTDKIITKLGINLPNTMISLRHSNKDIDDTEASLKYDKMGLTVTLMNVNEQSTSNSIYSFSDCLGSQHSSALPKFTNREPTTKNTEVSL